jgi:hypothetical protein
MAYNWMVDWIIPSFEQFGATFGDPYYADVIVLDEANFLDKSERSALTATMVHAHQIVENSKAVM